MPRLGRSGGVGVASSAVSSDVLVVEPDEDAPGLPVDPVFLEDLRRARRRRRVSGIHWVDALYHAYLAALFGTIAVAVATGAIGDTALSPAQLDDVTTRGPAVIGLFAALAVGVGLRSGSRGGPLAVEPGDVRYVLLAPLDRGLALRGPALRQLRTGVFVAVLAGAVIGRMADPRFPEPALAWIAAGGLTGAAVAGLSLGAALIASGRRLSRPVATALAGVLVAWSAVDVAGVEVGDTLLPASPGRAVGWLALAPLDLHVAAAGALVAAVLAVVLGIAGVAGISIEAAERRTALVGQLRFAATLQDVRTVLVLRRQLAADQPRDRPWVRGPRRRSRFPGWRRSWNGLLRFPGSRVIRMLLMAVAAGAALRGAWAGTAPLVIVSGLAFWIAGLDVVEPLAQEVDHPSRRSLYPDVEGDLYVRLLAASGVVAVLLGLVAGGVAVVPGAGQVPLAAALVAGVATALTGMAGAVVNVVSGAPSQSGSSAELSMIAPEVAGTKTVLRTALPLVVGVLGALPLLIVEANDHAGRPLGQGAIQAWVAVAVAFGLVMGWVHQRQPIREWWAEAMEAQAALKSSGDDDEADDEDEDEDEDEENR